MELIGKSPAFTSAMQLVQRIARHDATVFIEGETGTGKELVARTIHYCSARVAHPFIPINGGVIPDTLLESELFGHRRGTFTDAKTDRPGLVTLADRGTLFLDEIDALTPKAQVALLRFLQDRRFRPLGARAEMQADVRIIAASNRDLETLAAGGQFRLDLLFRIKVLYVKLPPLRERCGDARLLAEHFLDQCARQYGAPPKRLHPRTLEWLDHYAWPGNVRELENLVQRAFLLADGDEVLVERPRSPLSGRMDDTDPCGPPAAPTQVACAYRVARAKALDLFNQQYLSQALVRAQGNVTRAARMAGKDRRSFGRLLTRYGVAPQAYREPAQSRADLELCD
jgi:two-component system, NtrC family, response regulator GlrR